MKLNEIVVISGKGGTGKTSLVASLIPYIPNLVIADCDVDAPDLDILIQSTLEQKIDFFGMKKADIDQNKCIKCGNCRDNCEFLAIDSNIKIDKMKCEGCSVCTIVCPVNAIEMKNSETGTIFESNSKYGKMFHARLIPGEEASGKLITNVRKMAKEFAIKNSKQNIIIDGSPGIACNVISSIMGVKKAIVVTEPTISGLHDLKRIVELLLKYPIKIIVVINKYTFSLEKTEEIERYCMGNRIEVELKIPFDKRMVESISNLQIPSLSQKEFFENIGFFKFIEKIKE
ncbi:MAG: ATP-binding protein [Cetobacterium sp.]